MKTFTDVINLWPSLSEFADDIGVKYVTAQVMRYRGSIAPTHWSLVAEAAKRRGYHGVTIERLAKMKMDGKPRPKRRALQPAA